MSRASPAEIQEQAAIWVARMDGHGWSDRAEAELESWIEADPRHNGALLAAQAAWSMLEPRVTAPAPIAEPVITTPVAARRNRRWVLGGIASAGIAASLTAFVIGGRGTRYSTGIGEIRRVPLADGSTAAINTASQIAVMLEPAKRRVVLAAGEAWFQVAKDQARPFVVEAGPVRVRAVGTAFAVRRRENGADVLVTEGVVEAWSEDFPNGRVRLEAGKGSFVPDHAAAEPLATAPSAVDRSLAWRSGHVDLMGQPLSAAVAEFNRYNRRQLVIADPALAQEAFDGVFRTDDPAGFATMVHASLAVPVSFADPDRIEIGAPPK